MRGVLNADGAEDYEADGDDCPCRALAHSRIEVDPDRRVKRQACEREDLPFRRAERRPRLAPGVKEGARDNADNGNGRGWKGTRGLPTFRPAPSLTT